VAVSGMALMVGVLVVGGGVGVGGVGKREVTWVVWPAAKGAFFGAFTYVCEQVVKSLL